MSAAPVEPSRMTVPTETFAACEKALHEYSQYPTDYHRSVLRMKEALSGLIDAAQPSPTMTDAIAAPVEPTADDLVMLAARSGAYMSTAIPEQTIGFNREALSKFAKALASSAGTPHGAREPSEDNKEVNG